MCLRGVLFRRCRGCNVIILHDDAFLAAKCLAIENQRAPPCLTAVQMRHKARVSVIVEVWAILVVHESITYYRIAKAVRVVGVVTCSVLRIIPWGL